MRDDYELRKELSRTELIAKKLYNALWDLPSYKPLQELFERYLATAPDEPLHMLYHALDKTIHTLLEDIDPAEEFWDVDVEINPALADKILGERNHDTF